MYIILAKLKDPDSEHGGCLQIVGFTKAESDDDKANRVTVGSYAGETPEYWRIVALRGGTYRFESELGMAEHPEAHNWDSPRSLAVVDGKLRNVSNHDNDPSQAWTLTKVR